MAGTPNGCRWCGLNEREHFQRWSPIAHWHGWTPPTDAQRLARMQARRAARQKSPAALALNTAVFAALYAAAATPPGQEVPSRA